MWQKITLQPSKTALSAHQAAIDKNATLNAGASAGISALQALSTIWPTTITTSNIAQARAQLDDLCANGAVIGVHAWDYSVGHEKESGNYLSPQNALKRLAEKLVDAADSRTPHGKIGACSFLVCAGDLNSFIKELESVTKALPFPHFLQALRLARATFALDASKMEQASAMLHPHWPELGELTTQPLRDYRKTLLGELSGAIASASPVSTLQELSALRARLEQEQAAEFEKLSTAKTSLFVKHAAGTPSNVAAALLSGVPSDSNVHTAAVLVVGDDLKFLKEIL